MSKELVVSATSLETKVAILEDDQVTEIFVERAKSRGILGNIYKGRVTKVLPGMQSAFVDIGLERDAFLYVSDFFEDYEEYDKMFSSAEQEAQKALFGDAVPTATPVAQEGDRRRERTRSPGRERPTRARTGRSRSRDDRRPPVRSTEPPVEQPEGIEPVALLGPDAEVSGTQSLEPFRDKALDEAPRDNPWSFSDSLFGSGSQSPEPPNPPSYSSPPQLEVSRPPAEAPFFESRRSESQRSEWQREEPRREDRQREESQREEARPDEAPVEPSRPSVELSWLEEIRQQKEELERQRRARDNKSSESAGAGQVEPDAESRVQEKPDADYFAVPEDGAPTERPVRRKPLRWKNRRSNRNERPDQQSIGDLLREGQEILVQVAKEPIAKKGARITSHIALPGRYLVFMPTVDHVGVSRKIEGDKERARLREIITKFRAASKRGFIVRTAGGNRPEEDFQQDMSYLTRLWDDIRSKMERASAPSMIHSELDLVQRLLRDYVSEDFSAIRVDDEGEYERVIDFINKVNPAMINRVKLYNKSNPIFEEYGISPEIEKALKSKVWLKSGGYIVINQTEALVAIDVNTGKFVGRSDSLEDTITRTNLDAVKEVVRQIRLRDLGGIIIIDFIDMDERRNRQKVMDALQLELEKDKSPTKILQFNEFGLVALTRKRVKQSLERTLCQPCPYCDGSSMVKSIRTMCYAIHADVKRMVPFLGDGQELLIRCHPDVSKGLRDKEKEVLDEMAEMCGKDITVKSDPLLHFEKYDIVEM